SAAMASVQSFRMRSSSRRARKLIKTIQLSKYDSLLDITIQKGIPYPACRRGVPTAGLAANAATSRRRLFIKLWSRSGLDCAETGSWGDRGGVDRVRDS